MKTNTETQTVSAVLPWFPGFYESIFDSFIDQEVESEIESSGEGWETVNARCNYSSARHNITKAWVDAFSQETGIPMEFQSLESPREYNFTTDRSFVNLGPEALGKLETAKASVYFAEVLRAWFTSRSGFMSFYSSDVDGEEWQKPVNEWDHNQLSALIAAFVLESGETEDGLLDSIHGTSRVYEAAQSVWDAVPA